eukprot:366311-Chlamydomonas_euryale.AAC.26
MVDARSCGRRAALRTARCCASPVCWLCKREALARRADRLGCSHKASVLKHGTEVARDIVAVVGLVEHSKVANRGVPLWAVSQLHRIVENDYAAGPQHAEELGNSGAAHRLWQLVEDVHTHNNVEGGVRRRQRLGRALHVFHVGAVGAAAEVAAAHRSAAPVLDILARLPEGIGAQRRHRRPHLSMVARGVGAPDQTLWRPMACAAASPCCSSNLMPMLQQQPFVASIP